VSPLVGRVVDGVDELEQESRDGREVGWEGGNDLAERRIEDEGKVLSLESEVEEGVSDSAHLYKE